MLCECEVGLRCLLCSSGQEERDDIVFYATKAKPDLSQKTKAEQPIYSWY